MAPTLRTTVGFVCDTALPSVRVTLLPPTAFAMTWVSPDLKLATRPVAEPGSMAKPTLRLPLVGAEPAVRPAQLSGTPCTMKVPPEPVNCWLPRRFTGVVTGSEVAVAGVVVNALL